MAKCGAALIALLALTGCGPEAIPPGDKAVECVEKTQEKESIKPPPPASAIQVTRDVCDILAVTSCYGDDPSEVAECILLTEEKLEQYGCT